jgi:transposase
LTPFGTNWEKGSGATPPLTTHDRIDANKICDCLRCDFLPECYMASTAIRERRRTLRYRNLLVHQMVQMKNKISGLLMEAGVNYNKQRLHKAGYFRELLATNPDIDEGLVSLLRLCRETVVRLQRTESALVRSLERDSLLIERVERLMIIPAVGPITALTWALEVGDVKRFSSIKKTISYCGLCGAEKSSANAVQRTPLSKQRNKHLQTTLIEAARWRRATARNWPCSMTRKSRKAMPIARRWRWHGSWWPTSWRSTVHSAIFRWWRRTASLPRASR